MNTAPYTLRGTKVLIYKLQGRTARNPVCRTWFFMLTEGRTAKFPTRNKVLQTL